LLEAVEAQGWDGAWYRRAYFDDGTPLGSRENEECQIDSIAQSWAVISKLGNGPRSRAAMAAVRERLVLGEEGLVLLFAPPFFRSPLDPGYVKGYVPGVRENGGQYTHAAIWAMMAFASLGDKKTAHGVFSLLSPLRHSASPAQAEKYKVEPYVIAADVYGASPHVGRGGWTWYTGSAAWYYRAGLEYILGLRREGERLRFFPCAPEAWGRYEVDYRVGSSLYKIMVENSAALSRETLAVELDGKALEAQEILLKDDGRAHVVRVSAGALACAGDEALLAQGRNHPERVVPS
jgi:cellobiose phosphorylase